MASLVIRLLSCLLLPLVVIGCTGPRAPRTRAAAPPLPTGPVFHVAPDGDDAGPGTEERPFRTLARARDAVRGVNRTMSEDIEVWLHDGIYRLTEPVAFGPEDSGFHGHRVVYRAAPGARPVVSGGAPVTGWTRHDATRTIYRTDAGRRRFRQLYLDGRPAIRAREPNRVSSTHFGPYLRLAAPNRPECRVADDDWRRCAEVRRRSDVELVITSHWYQQRIRIGAHRADGDAVAITPVRTEGKFTKKPHFYGKSYFHFENALAFVDAPGEWYHDPESGSLYVAVTPGTDPNRMRIEIPRALSLVAIRGTAERPVHDLELRGITFECTNWTSPSRRGLNITQFAQPIGVERTWENRDYPPGVIRAAHARRIALRRCVVRHTGATGVQFFRDVDDSDLEGNRIHDVAANGIEIDAHAETNPAPVAQSTGVAIWNNVITRAGQSYTNGGGLLAHNVRGLIVEHNLIHDLPYSGMQIGNQPGSMRDLGCGDNRIRFNHVHHCCQLHDDGGGIYTLGGIQEGTEIAENVVHDVRLGAWAGTYKVDHIYLDNFSSRILVRDNVVRGGRAAQRNRAKGNTFLRNRQGDPEVEANAGLKPGYDPRAGARE